MARRIVLSPHAVSSSIRSLATYLIENGGSVVTRRPLRSQKPSKTQFREDDIAFNYGVANHEYFKGATEVYNAPDIVGSYRNKLITLGLFPSEMVVPWTREAQAAHRWHHDGIGVVKRTTLTGMGGEGIEVMMEDEEIPEGWFDDGQLFTQYIAPRVEFRVHFFNEEFIIHRKRISRRADRDEGYLLIRNHDMGWIYSRVTNLNAANSRRLNEVAKEIRDYIPLHFGAIDIIWDCSRPVSMDSIHVLEVNTAPGMEGTTIEFYGQNLLEIANHE